MWQALCAVSLLTGQWRSRIALHPRYRCLDPRQSLLKGELDCIEFYDVVMAMRKSAQRLRGDVDHQQRHGQSERPERDEEGPAVAAEANHEEQQCGNEALTGQLTDHG